MDLYGQSFSRAFNIGSDESSGWFSAVRVGGSVRKVFDRDSGVEKLCRIVLSCRGTGYSEIKGALQLFNFSALGKITIVIVTLLTLYLKCPCILQEDLTGEDFKEMPGSLLYKLLQTKSKYPLHAAVRLMREDVVFLYLVEHNAEVSSLLLPLNHYT